MDKVNPIVLICARGHSVVTYTARRDQPPPPCPICKWVPPAPPKKETA